MRVADRITDFAGSMSFVYLTRQIHALTVELHKRMVNPGTAGDNGEAPR
jgi:hypothetical protein